MKIILQTIHGHPKPLHSAELGQHVDFHLPRIGETIYYRKVDYEVISIIHDYDTEITYVRIR